MTAPVGDTGQPETPAPMGPRVLARRLSLLAVLAVLAVTSMRAWWLDYDLERALWLARASGWSAAGALLLTLTMSPIARLQAAIGARRPPPGLWLALRRSLGITAALLGIAHAVTAAFGFLHSDWHAIIDLAYLRAGLLTLAILVPLLVTSFPALTRALGVTLWKPLHRLAYGAAALLLQHLLLSPFAPRRLVLALFLATVSTALLRFLPRRLRS